MKVVVFITDYAAADDRVKAFFDKYLRGKNVRISTATIENWKH